MTHLTARKCAQESNACQRFIVYSLGTLVFLYLFIFMGKQIENSCVLSRDSNRQGYLFLSQEKSKKMVIASNHNNALRPLLLKPLLMLLGGTGSNIVVNLQIISWQWLFCH